MDTPRPSPSGLGRKHNSGSSHGKTKQSVSENEASVTWDHIAVRRTAVSRRPSDYWGITRDTVLSKEFVNPFSDRSSELSAGPRPATGDTVWTSLSATDVDRPQFRPTESDARHPRSDTLAGTNSTIPK